jgi:hypothetical protein
VFLFGQISPNFDLKNTILTYTKKIHEFFFEIHPILKKKKVSKLPNFYDKFHYVGNQEYFSFHI